VRHADAQNTDCAGGPGSASYETAWQALRGIPAATYAATDAKGRVTVLCLSDADASPCLRSFEPDGSPRWESSLVGPSLSSIAVDPGGNVFAADGRHLTALDDRGALRWQTFLPVEVPALHFLSAGRLLAPGIDGSLNAFDTAAGKALAPPLRLPCGPMPWGTAGRKRIARRRCRHLGRAFARIGADPAYAGQAARRFLGIGVSAKNVPAVDGTTGRIYQAATDESGAGGVLYGVDLERAGTSSAWRVAFRTKMGPGCDSSPGVSPVTGRVYCPDREGRLYAFDGVTGRVVWSFDTGGGSSASFAVAGDTLYGALHRELIGIQDLGDRGEAAWRADVAEGRKAAVRLNSVPLVAGGFVNVVCTFGRRRLGVFVPGEHALLTFDRLSGRMSGRCALLQESCCTLSMGPDGTLYVPSKPMFKGVALALHDLLPLPFLKASPEFHGLTALRPSAPSSQACQPGDRP
jgi:outer membrane protein assembly factor BamB